MNFSLANQIEKDNVLQTYDRYPIVIERGQGAILYDTDNNKYIDMTSGIGVSSLGYNNEGLIKAIDIQMQKVFHCSNLYYNPTNLALSLLLTNLSHMAKVFFCNSGAEANEGAIKIARKYAFDKYDGKRNKIITLKNSFHGRTITTLSATGQDKYHNYFYPFTEGFVHVEINNIEEFKNSLDDTVSAVMMEAIQGEGGIRAVDINFAKELQKLCNSRDILLILDEVQCGIGRTGTLFAYEALGITPDIVTTAKGLGGGIPIGAVLCNSKLENVLKKGDHGSTFGGNLIASAAAIEVLTQVSTKEFLNSVQEKGAYIVNKLKNFKTDKIIEIRGSGLMLGLELSIEVKDVILSCKDNGVLFLSAGKNVIRMLPPLVISYEEIDEAMKVLQKVLS